MIDEADAIADDTNIEVQAEQYATGVLVGERQSAAARIPA